MGKMLLYFFTESNQFKKEFKKQIRMMIVIALGFTIAFTWRQTVFDVSKAIINTLIKTQSSS